MLHGLLTKEDVELRLHQTLCMYNNEPVYVTVDRTDPVDIVQINALVRNRQEATKVSINSDLFEAGTLNLGYMNYKTRAFFILRDPVRRQQLGVPLASIYSENSALYIADVAFTVDFSNMVLNKYPKFDTCINNVSNGKNQSMAFSRNLAVKRIEDSFVGLYLRESLVGVLQGSKVTLTENKIQRAIVEKILDQDNIKL